MDVMLGFEKGVTDSLGACRAESATESCPAESAKAYGVMSGALKLLFGGTVPAGSLDVGSGLIEQAVNSSTFSEGAPLGVLS